MIRLFILLACLASVAAAQSKPETDLRLMMNGFEGRFDNYQQVIEEKESTAEFPHEHIHSIFARVNLPRENVFYVKQYMDGDEAKTTNKHERAQFF